MKEIIFDLETRSLVDLPACGAWRYAHDPSADILVLAWACGSESGLWAPNPPFPGVSSEVPAIFSDPEAAYIAHNASFELALTLGVLIPRYGFPEQMRNPHRWHCTASMGRSVGLPGALDDMSKALGIGEKNSDGAGLIARYSVSVKDKMGDRVFRDFIRADWEAMCEYNRQDVILTRLIWERLKRNPTVQAEREFWLHDLVINTRGIRVDLEALAKVEDVQKTIDTRAVKESAALGFNPNSGPQLKAYLARKGVHVKTAQAAELDQIYTTDSDARRVLELRKYTSKASLKKYAALRDHITGERLRNSFRYFGAGTGRFAGNGFQVHNLIKTGTNPEQIDTDLASLSGDMAYKEFTEAAQRILPGLLIPDPGHVFIMGDFNAIEARVSAYLAGAKTMLELFATGQDPYKHMAAAIYNIPVDQVTKAQRQVGKMAVLGCSYGVGAKKYYEISRKMGAMISEGESNIAVNTYRLVHKEIPKIWGELERAFKWVLSKKVSVTVGIIKIRGVKNSIEVTLPSGRSLWYHGCYDLGRDGLSYMAYRTKTDVKLWGGMILENITQAVARDIMCDRMYQLEGNGLPVFLHCHDEIVSGVPEGQEDKKAVYDTIMNTAPDWFPGFPLKTESVISRRYFK